jgi:hypothetical protein
MIGVTYFENIAHSGVFRIYERLYLQIADSDKWIIPLMPLIVVAGFLLGRFFKLGDRRSSETKNQRRNRILDEFNFRKNMPY